MTTTRLDITKIRRILIRATNWVGDAVLTTPAIRALHKNFPDAEISILAKPWVAPVFFGNSCVDNILEYDATGRHGGWLGKLRLVKALRTGKFDLAILFQNAFEAALLAYLAGIPNRLGYDTDGRRLFLTHSIKIEPRHKQIHEIDYYLGIIQGAGLDLGERALTLTITAQERDRSKEVLATHHVSDRDTLVGVNPGATYGSAKRWFPERYAALCDRMSELHDVRIMILGGPGEEGVGRQVSESMRHPSVNLCGKTNLREAFALIERCQLFVTNDSGLMHVAAALDVPLVAIFGSTNPRTTGPSSSRSCIVQVPIPCSPCLQPECSEDHQCMREITVDMVYDVARTLLEETRGK